MNKQQIANFRNQFTGSIQANNLMLDIVLLTMMLGTAFLLQYVPFLLKLALFSFMLKIYVALAGFRKLQTIVESIDESDEKASKELLEMLTKVQKRNDLFHLITCLLTLATVLKYNVDL